MEWTWKERLLRSDTPLVERLVRDVFLEKIKTFKGKDEPKVLSVSTGDGIWDYLVLNSIKVKSLTATDIIDNPLEGKAEREMKSLGDWRFVRVKAEKELPFKSNFFNLVYHMDVVEHTRKPYLFLSEQYRVLKKGGMVIVGTPNLFRPMNLIRILLGRLRFPLYLGEWGKTGECVHQMEFHERSLKLLMEETGFKKVEVLPLYFGLGKPDLYLSLRPKSGSFRQLCHYLVAVGYK